MKVIDYKYIPAKFPAGSILLLWLVVDVWLDWAAWAIGGASVLSAILVLGFFILTSTQEKTHPTKV